MSDNISEINNLIAEFKAKFGDTVNIEIISDEAPTPVIEREPDGDTLPAELAQMIEAAARELAARLGFTELSSSITQFSAIDDSPEAAEAMAAMRRQAGLVSQSCYHYILDSTGNPVHCEDEEEVRRFQRRDGHLIAEKKLQWDGVEFEIVTAFIVHNAMINGQVPVPHWITVLGSSTVKQARRWFWHSAAEARAGHASVVKKCIEAFAKEHRTRRPSPRRLKVVQRRLAAGQSVLRKRGGR